MHPLSHRQAAVARHVLAGKVAIHRHVRRAPNFHHHFALCLFVAPAHHGRIGLFGSEPGLGGVGTKARRQSSNILSTGDSLAGLEMPGLTDDAGTRRRTAVFGRKRARRVSDRVPRAAHVHDRHEAIGRVEDCRSVGLTLSVSFSPVQRDRSAGIAFDNWDTDPNASSPWDRVPLFDFVGQRLSLGRESNIGAVRQRLAEIEPFSAEPYEDREPFFPCRSGKICSVRRREDSKHARMLPIRVRRGRRWGTVVGGCRKVKRKEGENEQQAQFVSSELLSRHRFSRAGRAFVGLRPRHSGMARCSRQETLQIRRARPNGLCRVRRVPPSLIPRFGKCVVGLVEPGTAYSHPVD